jgi:hypothetical protein
MMLFLMVSALLGAPQAATKPQAPSTAAVTRLQPGAVVRTIRQVIARRYVILEKRAPLDKLLARGLASGRYSVADEATLVRRINEDLGSANDRHLVLRFDPQQAKLLQSAPGDPKSADEAFEEIARARNYGITELRVLDGNVRSATFDGFIWTGHESAEAYGTAMRFLKDGAAVIIDLRRNGGGSPEAVHYVISHFVPAHTPLVDFHMESRLEPDRIKAAAGRPAGSMLGKPLYVLTSARTASAGEEFVGHVLGYKLGEVIGERTAGAAFRNDFFDVGQGFVLSVSVGRPVLASTGGDWERTGFAPTTATDAARAFDVAQAQAKERLARIASDETRSASAAAQVTPALPLEAYAGEFEQGVVALEGGHLVVNAPGGPARLVPLGGHSFAIEGDPRVKTEFIEKGGIIEAVRVTRPDGSQITQRRTK